MPQSLDKRTWHPLADGCPPAWVSSWGEDNHGPWCGFHIGRVVQCLRWIPPGRFWMGSPEDEEGRSRREGPRHVVTISQGYWLFDTPVTQELWQAVMGNNPSGFEGPRRPVEQVSWEDCQQFLGAVNERVDGLGLTLPSEAQWEYACRAGTQGVRYDDLDAIAWHEGNSEDQTHAVGEKQPNPWGLHDMLGNVYEWCHDGLREYTAAAVTDPRGPTDAGAVRVLRGGTWFFPAQYVRAAFRDASLPGFRYRTFGFRCSSSGELQGGEAEPAE
jgi:formylglycine-generating enzyme required for sulfatase activity